MSESLATEAGAFRYSAEDIPEYLPQVLRMLLARPRYSGRAPVSWAGEDYPILCEEGSNRLGARSPEPVSPLPPNPKPSTRSPRPPRPYGCLGVWRQVEKMEAAIEAGNAEEASKSLGVSQ